MSVLTVNGARHYFRLEGSPTHADKVVLIHSVGSDLSLWDKCAEALTKHFQVLRYDVRGHGGSEVTPGEYTLDLLCNDLMVLTHSLGWSRFAVGGVSLGGMIGLQVAASHRNAVDKLLICSTAAKMPVPRHQWDATISKALEVGMKPFAAALPERMFSDAYRQSQPAEMHSLCTVQELMNPIGYSGALGVLRDANLVPLLPNVQSSVMLATGSRDPLVDNSVIKELADGLPNFEHVELDSGHYPMVETPHEFNNAAIAFFSKRGTV